MPVQDWKELVAEETKRRVNAIERAASAAALVDLPRGADFQVKALLFALADRQLPLD